MHPMPTIVERMKMRMRILCWLALGIASLWRPRQAVYGAQPGDLFEWPIARASPLQILRLRYCPAGSIYPGPPEREATADASSIPPTSIRPFYLGETEVTLAQYRAVLGDDGIAALKTEAARFQAMNPQLFALVQQGDREPAFFVGLPGAIRFCLRLQAESDANRAAEAIPSVETRRVRLPSHVEWQYGARAMIDAATQAKRPHFHRDLKLSDLSPATQEKCREVWAKLGRATPFVCSQEQLLDLTSAVAANEQAKVKEILSEAFRKLVGGPPRNTNGVGAIPWDCLAQPNDAPNAWGIYDVHDNVTEWVMWAGTASRRDELWKTLSAKVADGDALNGQANVFLAGGCFLDSYLGEKALSRFTLWGGPKLTNGMMPQPFEYQSDLVGEFNPGFRVLIEREIAADWLYALRKGLYADGRWTKGASSHLDKSQQLTTELTDGRHPCRQAIEFYRTLIGLETDAGLRASQVFEQLASFNAEAPSRPKKPRTVMLDEQPVPAAAAPGSPPAVSDDVLFWNTLAVVHAAK
jgi:formylglycine-generating enzyme required for sulfatase activity